MDGEAAGLRIRRASVDDAAGIAAVLNRIIAGGRHSLLDTPFSEEEERAFIASLPARAFIHAAVTSADQIAGFQTVEPWSTFVTREFGVKRSGSTRKKLRQDWTRLSSIGTVEVVSSAWMNRKGPPARADCHIFDDTTTCLRLGRIRYCGSSATPRCSENGLWQGKLAAVAMSIRIGVRVPRNSCAVCSGGPRGGVNPNH